MDLLIFVPSACTTSATASRQELPLDLLLSVRRSGRTGQVSVLNETSSLQAI